MRRDRSRLAAEPARRLSGPVGGTAPAVALAAAMALLLLPPLRPARGADAAAGGGEPPEVAQTCLSCHGEPLANGAPPIAGQGNNYIQLQLVFFRSGRRKNEIMQAMAGGLADNDIRALGKYFSSLPAPSAAPPPDDNAGLSKAGEAAAARSRCAACHGDGYLGAQAAPRVKGLPEPYLVEALSTYRDGTRPSSGGAAMNEVAGALSDDDIKALAHYLAAMP